MPSRSRKPWTTKRRSGKQSVAQKGEIFDVEEILDRELRNGVNYYYLKWKNYGPEFNTWEPSQNLVCPSLQKQFDQDYTMKQKIIKDMFGDCLKMTEKQLEQKLAEDRVSELVGGVNYAGKLYVVVEWENDLDNMHSLVRFDILNKKMPELFAKAETFTYFK